MIRNAKFEDIEAILEIVRKAVAFMRDDGNDQWNSSYPVQNDFYNDIKSNHLFVDAENEGRIKSFVCLNQQEPDEYAGVKWSVNIPALVIHRMAVAPLYHGRGLAKELFNFAERKAVELNLHYIRSDTCSRNISMNTLFRKFGYKKAGKIRLPGYDYDYNCYEKILEVDRGK